MRHGCRLRPRMPGIRHGMHALVTYRTWYGPVTVWAFVTAILVAVVAGWYARRGK